MNDVLNLRGSIVALVTPFDAAGNIDYSALDTLVKFHLDNNTDGIVVCGTTGEASTLSDLEYREIVSFVVQKVDHLIPVIAGSGGNSTAFTLAKSQIAIESGVDALLVVTPYYNKPNPRGMYEHYKYIAENVDVPIILYNVPSRTGSKLSAELTVRLGREFSNIIGTKEATGDFNQLMEIINARPEGFKVYSGEDTLALAMVAIGADGCISVAANIIPKEFSEMIHAGLNFDFNRAKKILYKYLNIMNLNFIESNPIPVKTALFLMGMIQNEFRLPLAPLSLEANFEHLKIELQILSLINSQVVSESN
jgi:4-hydroxy-tetrahydrodipicolinate synthase